MLKRFTFKKISLGKAATTKTDGKTTPKKPKTQQTDKQCSGQAAENLAKNYLLTQGLFFVEKNYHSRHGEIDLILKDNDCIVFIEVRFRSQVNFGSACESIDNKKQKKIIKTAEHYLYKHRLTELVASRFDVIGISPSKNNSNMSTDKVHNDCLIINDNYYKKYSVEWIKNAFQAF